MKKNFFILVSIFLITLGIACIVLFFKLNVPPQIEDVLPQDPLFYFRIADIEKNIEGLVETQLWKNLKEIDYKTMLIESGFKESNFKKFKLLSDKETINSILKILKEFLGQEIAVAVYPGDTDNLSIYNIQDAFSGFVFVTRISQGAKFIEFLTRIAAKSSEDVSIKKNKYKGHTVNVVRFKEKKIDVGYVRIKDLIIFGVTDKAARDCLDVINKDRSSLSNSDDFLKIKKDYIPGTEIFGYLNMDQLLSRIKQYSKKIIMSRSESQEQEADEMIARFDKNFRILEGYNAIGISGILGRTSKGKIDVHFDRKKLATNTRSFYYCAPEHNGTMRFVPKEAWGYQWSACYDFDYHWQKAMNKRTEEPVGLTDNRTFLQRLSMNLNDQFGLSVEEDILPALGNEFGGFLSDIDTSGIFPFPRLCFFIEMHDQARLMEIIKVILEQQLFIQPQEEEYKNSVINYVVLPMMNNIQPGYSFVGKHMLVATHRELIKDAMDNFSEIANSLMENKKVEQIEMDLSGKSNFVFYLKLDKVITKAKELVDWWNQWSSKKTLKYEAFKGGGQKRLDDIKKSIEFQERELLVLEVEIKKIEKLQTGTTEDLSKTSEMDEEILKMEKFIEGFKKSIVKVKQEQKTLLEAKEADPPIITQDGEVRLLELAQLIEKRETKLKGSIKELKDLQLARSQLGESSERLVELKKSYDEMSKKLQSDKDAASEIESLVTEYERPKMFTVDARRVLYNSVARPFLEAFTAFKIFAAKIFISENVFEVFTYLTVE